MASKGQKYKHWTKEEKYELIKTILNNEKSQLQISKENNINVGSIHS